MISWDSGSVAESWESCFCCGSVEGGYFLN